MSAADQSSPRCAPDARLEAADAPVDVAARHARRILALDPRHAGAEGHLGIVAVAEEERDRLAGEVEPAGAGVVGRGEGEAGEGQGEGKRQQAHGNTDSFQVETRSRLAIPGGRRRRPTGTTEPG